MIRSSRATSGIAAGGREDTDVLPDGVSAAGVVNLPIHLAGEDSGRTGLAEQAKTLCRLRIHTVGQRWIVSTAASGRDSHIIVKTIQEIAGWRIEVGSRIVSEVDIDVATRAATAGRRATRLAEQSRRSHEQKRGYHEHMKKQRSIPSFVFHHCILSPGYVRLEATCVPESEEVVIGNIVWTAAGNHDFCTRLVSGCIIQVKDSAIHGAWATPGHAAQSMSGSLP